jgi:hypothetical protein
MPGKTLKLLPKLKKTNYKGKKYHYKLTNASHLRHKAINEGIHSEMKHLGKTRRQAATAKKGRLNVLRIYRRNKHIKHCNKITQDMRYIDKKYNLGKTTNICGKKSNKLAIT